MKQCFLTNYEPVLSKLNYSFYQSKKKRFADYVLLAETYFGPMTARLDADWSFYNTSNFKFVFHSKNIKFVDTFFKFRNWFFEDCFS